ncbi:MAG: alpha-L-fucosidase [Lentisphaeria bacterium]|nr:alpha-L-fucosidase [Lentisphaeria bacterium]
MQGFGKGDTSWFVHDRFGMFIHWGLYSMPARHEWIRNREEISDEDYEKYFKWFNPSFFNPKEWARTAREAGMKYFVITTKHHEGFCMWDSKYTDFKVTNTPCGRDLLREVVDAFRAEGLHVGFYYSLIDWHHTDFMIDSLHPLRSRPDRKELNAVRDMARYREYMQNQVRELLTEFGKIDIIWFDFSYPDIEDGKGHEDWGSEELVKMIRELQPGIIINNRLDLPSAGDILTPEQNTPEEPPLDKEGNPAVWEGCQTFSGSWGYFRDELSWKTEKQCIDLLINHVCRNGNLLMNVGPTSLGYMDSRALERLKGFAEWMKYHSRSIYGCGMAEGLIEPRDCRYTWNKETNRLYLHIMNWPYRHILLKGMEDKVAYAQFLHDGSEVTMQKPLKPNVHSNLAHHVAAGDLILNVPVMKPPVTVPVIEIFLK